MTWKKSVRITFWSCVFGWVSSSPIDKQASISWKSILDLITTPPSPTPLSLLHTTHTYTSIQTRFQRLLSQKTTYWHQWYSVFSIHGWFGLNTQVAQLGSTITVLQPRGHIHSQCVCTAAACLHQTQGNQINHFFNLGPTNWGTHRPQRLVICHWSIIPTFKFFMTLSIILFLMTSVSVLISALNIPRYWGPGGPTSKAPNFAGAVLIEGALYWVHVCPGS